jgi:hypothetical protein
MTRKKKPTPVPVKADKDTVAVRLLKTTRARLVEATAKSGLTNSSYIEIALLEKFEKDGIK